MTLHCYLYPKLLFYPLFNIHRLFNEWHETVLLQGAASTRIECLFSRKKHRIFLPERFRYPCFHRFFNTERITHENDHLNIIYKGVLFLKKNLYVLMASMLVAVSALSFPIQSNAEATAATSSDSIPTPASEAVSSTQASQALPSTPPVSSTTATTQASVPTTASSSTTDAPASTTSDSQSTSTTSTTSITPETGQPI